MTRNLAAIVGRALIGHAASDKYPTRSVEYMLAWIGMSWSAMLLLPDQTLHGTQFVSLLLLKSAKKWAVAGLTFGVLRIYALIRNGSWKRSPWLRLLCAWLGFQFWFGVTILNVVAINDGAFVYPILGCFPIFAFFEAYSCFRCGQDARRATHQSARLTDCSGNG